MTAQRRQRATLLAGGARSVGWKAGLGTAAAMEAVATNAPVVGFLTDVTRASDGRRVAVGAWTTPLFEPELAVRIDRDLTAEATLDDAHDAIGAVAAAIELVDLGAVDDLAAVLTANVFHRAYAVGPWTPLALDRASLEVMVDDEVRASGVQPAALLGDLVEVVRAVAAQAALAGARLRAGELVITGSAIPAIALQGGETLAVTLMGTASTVSVTV